MIDMKSTPTARVCSTADSTLVALCKQHRVVLVESDPVFGTQPLVIRLLFIDCALLLSTGCILRSQLGILFLAAAGHRVEILVSSHYMASAADISPVSLIGWGPILPTHQLRRAILASMQGCSSPSTARSSVCHLSTSFRRPWLSPPNGDRAFRGCRPAFAG